MEKAFTEMMEAYDRYAHAVANGDDIDKARAEYRRLAERVMEAQRDN